MKNLKLLLLVLFISTAVKAQTGEGNSLNAGQVNVIQDYKPTLADAVKINTNPTVNDSVPPIPKLEYSNLNKTFVTDYKVEPITPAKMKGEPLQKLKNNYLKVGFGNYFTSNLEAYLGSGRSKKMNYSFSGKHFSSAGNIKNHGYAGFSENNLKAQNSIFVPDHVIHLNAMYKNNSMHYYGYNTDSNLVKPDYNKSQNRQIYNLIDFNGALVQNTRNDEALYHEFNLGFHHFRDKLMNQENSFNLTAAMGKKVGNELYGGRILFNYFGNQSSPDSSEGAIFTINPFVKTSGKKWHARLGINVAIETDEGKTHFLPDISGKYNIVEDIVSVYADIKGYSYRNSFRSLTSLNPFISPAINFRTSTVKLDAVGGIRGNINQHLYLNVNGAYKIVDSMALFVNIPYLFDTLQSAFQVIYDDIKIARFYGELGYVVENKLNIATWLAFNKYSQEKELKAWHLPALEAGVKGSYNLGDKIIVGLDIFYVGTRYAKNAQFDKITPAGIEFINGERKLKGYVDASINAEYRYTKKLAAFIRLNNLAAQQYQIWNFYPSQKINGLLGINYSF
ncbi:MAG TPA: hypothetical protein PK323_05955 [Bacteroidia bacterium]|nr:hypothetical protein [Bacteroidia bacterium]